MHLTALDTAAAIEDMDIAGFKLHAPTGRDRGRWSIWANEIGALGSNTVTVVPMYWITRTSTDAYAQSTAPRRIHQRRLPATQWHHGQATCSEARGHAVDAHSGAARN